MPKIRRSTSLKFAAVAIGVAGIVGLTISSASSLNLAGGTVAAAATTVASCQLTGQVSVNFDTTYSAALTTPGYAVTSVTVGNIDPNCKGQNVKVTLTASGTAIGEFTGAVPAGATARSTVALVPTSSTTAAISATSVDGTSVVIYN
ncbi:MAG: hypothetical protein QOF36_1708 [Microbacteriaceae bacterium]|jgi:hypothetical protein|nr:hypothetical protein [Microbacteriaceae bacterium]